MLCKSQGRDVFAHMKSIETQFGAHCADCMKLRKWAKTNQIPQALPNSNISFSNSWVCLPISLGSELFGLKKP